MADIVPAIKRFVDDLAEQGIGPPTEIMFEKKADLERVAYELDSLRRQPLGKPYYHIKVCGVNLSYNYLKRSAS